MSTSVDINSSDLKLIKSEPINNTVDIMGNYPGFVETVDQYSLNTISFEYTHDDANGYFFMIRPVVEGFGSFLPVVTNLSIKCCNLSHEFSYEVQDCSSTFNPSTDNNGNVFYTWNFDDGTISFEENPTHEFLHSGTYDVCLTVFCPGQDASLAQTYCEEIVVLSNDICNNCSGDNQSVSALNCGDEEDFEVSVCFDIPEGAVSCDGSEQPFIFSDNTLITFNDYESIDPSTGNDEYCVSINMTPDQGGDFESNGETIYLQLCDSEGNRICVSSQIVPTECATCNDTPVNVIASCDLDNSNDVTTVFEGSFSLQGDYESCTPIGTSEVAGLEVVSATYDNNTGNTTVDIVITTDNNLSGSYNGTIALCDEFGNIVCQKITIEPVSCPDDCRQKWQPKTLTCEENLISENSMPGYLTYNWIMMFDDLPLGWCEDGLEGYIDGNGSIEINSYSSTQNTYGLYSIEFDLNISIPCGNEEELEYNLYLYGCDLENASYCYHFPLIFEDCDCEQEVDGDDFETIKNLRITNSVTQKIGETYELYPNPTKETLNLRISDIGLLSSELKMEIYELNGRKIISETISSIKSEWDLSMINNGVYIVSLTQGSVHVKTERLVIIK